MSPSPATEGADRVLTVPNLLSTIRLVLIPVFVWVLFGRHNRAGAAFLLAGLGATDWVDGYVARRFDQVTNLGKVLDPTADRLLLGTAVISILVDGSVPAAVAVPAIAREALVSVAVLVLAAMGARRIDVTWAGKCGTFGMMVAFPLFLVSNDHAFALRDPARVAAWAAAAVGLAFGYYSAAMYVPIARSALEDGRRSRLGRAEQA